MSVILIQLIKSSVQWILRKKQLGDSQGHNVVPQYVDSKQLFPVKFTYVWCNRKVCVCFSQLLLIKSQCVTAKHRFLQVNPPISGRNKDMIWAVFQTSVGWWLIRGLYWPTSRFFCKSMSGESRWTNQHKATIKRGFEHCAFWSLQTTSVTCCRRLVTNRMKRLWLLHARRLRNETAEGLWPLKQQEFRCFKS
jgi:hypothetical protein